MGLWKQFVDSFKPNKLSGTQRCDDYLQNTEMIEVPKHITQDPWENVERNYPINGKARGKVVSISEYGAFAELEDGVEGLVHISEMTWDPIQHPAQILKIGDNIDVMILNVDLEKRRISLGMKQLLPTTIQSNQDSNNSILSKGTLYEKAPVFRKTKWAMTKDEVRSLEGLEPDYVTEDIIGYKDNIIDLQCNIVYIFLENKLVRAKYIITEPHSNLNSYISDFDKIKEMLIMKYGKPVTDNQFWRNDLYRDNYQDWGSAISVGHMGYFASWETNSTTICEALTGDNYEIFLHIEYSSKEAEQLEEQYKTERELNQMCSPGRDFRQIKWGASVAFVKNAEQGELVYEDTDLLVYNGCLNGLTTHIVYVFANDMLVRGKYVLTTQHSYKNQYINDYETLKDILNKKYGKPQQDDQFWLNSLYKDDFQEWGTAVSVGHLSYSASWNMTDSAILLVLYGDNYEITLAIEFKSIKLTEIEKNTKKESELDKF
jgi:predicted RNA-binding protein with RPS1 domain